MDKLTKIVSAHIGAAIVLCTSEVVLAWKSIEMDVIKEGVFRVGCAFRVDFVFGGFRVED
jgi:hypothetical protein